MRSISFVSLLLTALTVHATPPVTEERPFSYTLHGVTIEDPYFWLEGSDAPEVAPDPDLDLSLIHVG
ncbi:MAG: hypothetical protein LOD94_04085, partial [Gammaproteobacteria bacterium]